jgi:hypothetical protein
MYWDYEPWFEIERMRNYSDLPPEEDKCLKAGHWFPLVNIYNKIKGFIFKKNPCEEY